MSFHGVSLFLYTAYNDAFSFSDSLYMVTNMTAEH